MMRQSVIDTATSSHEINTLVSAVIDALDPDETEEKILIGIMLCDETLGGCVVSAVAKIDEHDLTVSKSLIADAYHSAAEFGEPVPEYLESYVRRFM